MKTGPRKVGVFDAKVHLSRLLADAEAGVVTVITRRGRAVAVLAPPDAEIRPASPARDPLETLRAIRGRSRAGKETLGSLVNAARR